MKMRFQWSAYVLLGLLCPGFALAQTPNVRAWGASLIGSAPPGAPAKVSGIAGATAIAGGEYHSLVLTAGGTVWSWGGNHNGQLGNGSNANSTVPVPVSGLTGVTSIAAGDSFSLALKSDGTVWAWGANDSGQLGNGSNTDSSLPVQVTALAGVAAIAAGSDFSLAVKADGTVWAWGDNSSGQLGNASSTSSSVPVAVTGLTGVSSVAAGYDHSVALKSDGTAWAWGVNSDGELGNGTTTSSPVPVRVSNLIGGAAIAAGQYFSLALLHDNGAVVAWGNNRAGTLGDGNQRISDAPVPVSGLSGIVAIAGNNTHALALGATGLVWAWGSINSDGGLPHTAPFQVSSLNSVSAIAAGANHSLALKNDGTVWAWGDNSDGELGNGASVNRNVPAPFFGLADVAAVADAQDHMFALHSDGTVSAWGDNVYGVLGNASYGEAMAPVPVTGLTNVIGVGGGQLHSLAVKSDGSVWSWGGYLGNGPEPPSSPLFTSDVPVLVNGLSGAIAVAGGWLDSMVLKSDGTVWAWEYSNESGKEIYYPSQVEGLSNIIAISAYDFNAPLALKSDGSVWYWPEDTKANRTTVAQVTGLTGVVAIAAGGAQGLALKSDGTVWTWLNNIFGPFSSLDATADVPVQVMGLSNVVAIAAGGSHYLALTSDGAVWAWGANSSGELGNGNNADSSVPVQVSGLTNAISIAAGQSVSVAAVSGSTLPQITASSRALDFSSVPPGTSSAPQTITISNSGDSLFNLGSLVLIGLDPTDFVAGNQCAGTLAPSASCTIDVTFTPAGQGSRSAALLVTANATGSPIRVMLSGTGGSPSGSGSPSITAVVSASAFGGFQSVAPGSWVEIYGSNLAPDSRSWGGADFSGNNAPTSLDSVSVSIGGHAAFVDYISPTQVNAQLPSTVTSGATLPVVLTNNGAIGAPFNIAVNAIEPGLLAPASFKVGGKQYVVALLPDGSYAMPAGAISGVASRPAKPGETVVMYGVGFGAVTPDIPAGQIATESNQLAASIQILFGSAPAKLSYAGLAPNLVGLYQFNAVVPEVANNNSVPVSFKLGSTAGSQILYTAIHD